MIHVKVISPVEDNDAGVDGNPEAGQSRQRIRNTPNSSFHPEAAEAGCSSTPHSQNGNMRARPLCARNNARNGKPILLL